MGQSSLKANVEGKTGEALLSVWAAIRFLGLLKALNENGAVISETVAHEEIPAE
jgi:hypothetical protein